MTKTMKYAVWNGLGFSNGFLTSPESLAFSSEGVKLLFTGIVKDIVQ